MLTLPLTEKRGKPMLKSQKGATKRLLDYIIVLEIISKLNV